MKLPLIKSSSTSSPKLLINNKYIIATDNSPSKEPKIDSFVNKLNEVKEITIYLTQKFNAYDVDEAFIRDMEIEYAEQYLNKLEMLPTKKLINKLLALKPLEKCDFYLANETITKHGQKEQMKIINIYPPSTHGLGRGNKSQKNLELDIDNKQKNFQKFLSKNVQSIVKLKINDESRKLKEKITSIKKNNKSENNNLIYHKEKIDEIFNKEMDDLAELKLFSKKNSVNVDLSFENIKKKYVIIKKIEDYKKNERIYSCKGKFYSISSSISGQKNLLNDPKYAFDITEIKNLNDNIIKEVMEPLDVQIEIVMKDMNYILDNFPMDKFIKIDDDLNIYKNKNINNLQHYPKRSNSQSNHNAYKLSLDRQEDVVKILKVFHSMDFYRLVCLTLNLVYWIVFGNQNNVQIDQNTKEYLYLKLLTQIDIINSKISNMKLLSKIFNPLEIIIIRIEIENYLNRKFILLFDEKNPKNKEKTMIKVNNVITEIFDKHGYMNSFETICGTRDDLSRKISNNYLPRFKNKIFATSNMIEQLFSNDKSNISKNSIEDAKERQEYLLGPKVEFFNSYLNRVNNSLKKRNLAPIFLVSNKKQVNNNIKSDDENVVDNHHKKDLYLSLETDNKIHFNQRYINVEKYMDNSLKKLKGSFLKPIHNSKSTISKTEAITDLMK